MKTRIRHLITATALCGCLGIPVSSFVMAQTTETKKGGSSTRGVLKSVENIGSEILSLFGGSSDEPAGGATSKGPGRRKARIAMALTTGKTTLNAEQKSCESGNGICQFKIYPATQAPTSGTVVFAQAIMRPRLKQLIVEFEQGFDSSYKDEQGKIILTVQRKPNDPNDDDGVISVNNIRLAIQNGRYEVVNNRVVLPLQ